MNWRIYSNELQSNFPSRGDRPQFSHQEAREAIFRFLLEIVRERSPQEVLDEFRQLFIFGTSSDNGEAVQALYSLILQGEEETFRHALKRSCYILVNNWYSNRDEEAIHNLIQLLDNAPTDRDTLSNSINTLRQWLRNFLDSDDYRELKLFTLPKIQNYQEERHWTHRYSSYLLVPQYLDPRNPIEQREIARTVAKQLRDKFKFDLAMYAVHCDAKGDRRTQYQNPTRLGEDVVRLIKQVVSRQILFNYTRQAQQFVQESQSLTYSEFKRQFLRYLLFSIGKQYPVEILKSKLSEKLTPLYPSIDDDLTTTDLILRTCNRTIEFLTTENGEEPSLLFVFLTAQGHPLTLVTLFLKIVALCQYSRPHLEYCIAQLIRYYENSEEEDCQWFIDFLEIFNIVFTIYTENIKYDLVKIDLDRQGDRPTSDLDAYRLFCQLKGADLRGSDLQDADLRDTDLSLAKLNSANLRNANLENAKLTAADLSEVDLSDASLKGTDLRRTNLSQAILDRADLRRAKLGRANLSQARLCEANLTDVVLRAANLKQANLQKTDLRNVDLARADLRQSDLQGVTLEGADLKEANLSEANLSEANLNAVELTGANLSRANLKGALLRRASLRQANLKLANLGEGDLTGADLAGADLCQANLQDAFLRHANLSDTNLEGTNLVGAHLFGAKLKAIAVKGAKFGNNSGVSEEDRQQLIQAGAQFVSPDV